MLMLGLTWPALSSCKFRFYFFDTPDESSLVLLAAPLLDAVLLLVEYDVEPSLQLRKVGPQRPVREITKLQRFVRDQKGALTRLCSRESLSEGNYKKVKVISIFSGKRTSMRKEKQ